MTPRVIRNLTEAFLISKVLEAKRNGKVDFILPELLGSDWPDECKPFYTMYGNEKTAGCEMGKLLGKVGRVLGLKMQKEDRRGKKDAITRYFI